MFTVLWYTRNDICLNLFRLFTVGYDDSYVLFIALRTQQRILLRNILNKDSALIIKSFVKNARSVFRELMMRCDCKFQKFCGMMMQDKFLVVKYL